MRWLLHFTVAAAASATVFVALAALATAWSSQTASDTDEEMKAPHEPAATRIFADGVVEGAGRELSLRFEVAGRIKAVYASEGANVRTGDVLVELESDLADVQLAEAQTRLRMATAERDRVISPNQQGLSLAERTIAEAGVELAEAAVRRERLLADKLRLRAPIDGLVLRVVAEPGESAGPGDELVTLVDRTATRARAFVEELDGLRVAPGQAALISVSGNRGKSYRGTVRTCAPCFGPKTQRRLKPGERLDIRMREVVIELDHGDDLLVGMPVEAFIEPSQARKPDLRER